jgi:uncharacterized OB-fold protein
MATAAGSQEAVSAQPELMRLEPEGPVLLGSRCPECGRSYFPRRWECAVDLSPCEDVDLSRAGVLHVATYVRTPAYGREQRDAEGYGVGEVDLPEGVRVQSVLLGSEDSWVQGSPFRIVGEPIGDDAAGCARILFRFERDRGAGASS